MRYETLNGTDIRVSRCCLGSMTWGSQRTAKEGFAQLDWAVAHGVNFIDTAEMYPVPPQRDWWARTEEIIGSWLSARKGLREKVVLATKIAGPSEHFTWVRGGATHFDRKNLTPALDASCRRLGTEVVDLYQLHWPDRHANAFGPLGWLPEDGDGAGRDASGVALEETLDVLDGFVRAGRVRAIGVSNETPWGVMRLLAASDAGVGPRIVSIQNPYSLLNRSFEVSLAEVAWREKCGLLAYSPLAGGALSGKYLGGARPAGARFSRFPESARYLSPEGEEATAAWVSLARRHGLDPCVLAHAFVYSRPFLVSSIVGASDLEQLRLAVESEGVSLSDEILDEIEAVHARHTYPCP